jgi:hypothetical protein
MNIRRGAPIKPPAERKGNAVQVRLTDAEKENCELAAQAEGLKMSAWARRTLVKAADRSRKKS